MSRREIVLWPDPRLSECSAPVESFDSSLRALVQDLFDTMYAAEGRGLAAVQIGEHRAVFVMDETWKSGLRSPKAFINPHIIDLIGETVTSGEGCLSIPGIEAHVERHPKVCLRWQDIDAKIHQQVFDGFEAICIQHEFDHLQGRVTLDRLNAVEREKLLDAYTGVIA